MALTRKFLAALGIEADKIDEIITAHTATVDALKEERDKYKADAEKLPKVQKELDSIKGDEDWKAKYDSEHKAFEDFKKVIADEKIQSEKVDLYKKMLKDAKVDEKRIDAIIKITDFSKLKVKNGEFEEKENLEKAIKDEWAGFIVQEKTEGAKVSNPPVNSSGKNVRTREEIMKITDTQERQKAWGEYLENERRK